jgi:hypothetical protein
MAYLLLNYELFLTFLSFLSRLRELSVAVTAHESALWSVGVVEREFRLVVQPDVADGTETILVLVPSFIFFAFFVFFFLLLFGARMFRFHPLALFFVEPAAEFCAIASCEVFVAHVGWVSAVGAVGFARLPVGFVVRVDAAFDTAIVVEVFRRMLFQRHCRHHVSGSCSPVVA